MSIAPEIFEKTLDYFLEPIMPFLRDEAVREIMINGHDEIFIEEKGRVRKTDVRFESEEQLMAAVRNLAQYVGRFLRPDEPRFDARLPQGHRVHVVLPPICRQGISVTIRKHSKDQLSLQKLVELGSMSEEARDFLGLCMDLEKNIVVSGGTGTGKTTLLNALSELIPSGDRVLTIEDAAELQIQQDHVVSLEARAPDRKGRGAVTIRDLLHSSLRMRPDRIVVGECRGGEALDLLQAMNTGHGGSMSTLHANSAVEALKRLETLALFSGEEIPLLFIRAQVAAAIDIVVQLQRLKGRRLVHTIAEAQGLDEHGNYRVAHLFEYDLLADAMVRTEHKPSFDRELVNLLEKRGGH